METRLPPKQKERGYKRGEQSAINSLTENARRTRLVPGPGILLNETSNGTIITVDPNFRADGEGGAPRWL